MSQESIREFIDYWTGKGNEDQDSQRFWISLLEEVLEAEKATRLLNFEKTVQISGQNKKIDVYVPGVKALIEQKSIGKSLTKKYRQSDGEMLTPVEQARRYGRHLDYNEFPRWILTSNFESIYVYDNSNLGAPPEIIRLKDLERDYTRLGFLLDQKNEHIEKEKELSIEAGELVGMIYDALLEEYNNPEDEKTLESLNILAVRLVFLAWAEDAGVFERNQFRDYMEQFRDNPGVFRRELIELFQVLNTKKKKRADMYLEEDLNAFPHTNGGLFADNRIEIPRFNDKIVSRILDDLCGGFDWSGISPTIFGAVFESTISAKARRSGGMHYTSIENIHKVIDPLFLDDLKRELKEIKAKDNTGGSKTKALNRYIDKLASLQFFDPAAGSGNFLSESFICIRRLENEALSELNQGQIGFSGQGLNPIKVNLDQFHGIEINDFAVTVANTALRIAEQQTLKETESILNMPIDFLPLKKYENIHKGNALKIDWNEILPAGKCSYIMGNPPFVGASLMSPEQKKEAVDIFGKIRLSNSIDYVGAWFVKAAEYIQDTDVRVSFVATNSITQGEQVYPLWNQLINKYCINIQFAYRTFKWSSESSKKAAVHCVIIGFSNCKNDKEKTIFLSDGTKKYAENINPYLLDAPDVIINSRGKPICDVPRATMGNKPTDNGNFIITKEDYPEIIEKHPELKPYIKKYIGSREFINNDYRYCLWLKDAPPNILRNRFVKERLKKISEFRSRSSAKPTREKADAPHLFFSSVQPETDYILIPRVSSENRRYIPIGLISPDIIASDACTITHGGSLYEFGILTSNVHNAWMRTIAGRLKSDYRYSGGVVYNTFPWPVPTEELKNKIEEAARNILEIRKEYPESSLADLYDPITMPKKLLEAHQANDKVVMEAYGFDWRYMTEEECVAELMKFYAEKVESKH